VVVKYTNLGAICTLFISFFPAISHAEQPAPLPIVETRQDEYPTSERPHTVAELEAGVIALPNAPISTSQRGGNTPIIGTIGKGDATVQTGLHLLYRGDPRWAIGGGFMFAPRPTSDTQYGGFSGLERTHARTYLTLGAEGSYYPIRLRKFEAFVGLTIGGVVVADRFSTDSGPAVPSILGTPDVTLRTEGYAAGLQVGATWIFADRWIAGAAFRGDIWLLPESPQCSAIGDCTTLTGPIDVFELGLSLGYRLPL
jgi:hypothetical protein